MHKHCEMDRIPLEVERSDPLRISTHVNSMKISNIRDARNTNIRDTRNTNDRDTRNTNIRDTRNTNDSIITNNTDNTDALNKSITTGNTNWHSDRTLFYTYYAILYDTNLMSLRTMWIILLLGPLLIALPNLLIPLGINVNTSLNTENGRPTINGYSYLFFQIIYCTFGYPVLAFQFFNPLRNLLPKIILFTIVPVVTLFFIIILYYNLLIVETNNTQRNENGTYSALLPIIGITLILVFLWMMYLVLSIYRDRTDRVDNDLYDSKYVEIGTRVIMFAISLYLCYTFCVQYTLFFAQISSNNDDNFLKSLSTYGFIFLLQVFKLICNAFAQLIDIRLSSSHQQYYSMYFISTIQIDIYLVTFHRNLFTLLNSWTEFLQVIIGYLVFESIFFTFSISCFYLNVHNTLMNYSISPDTSIHRNSDVNDFMTFKLFLVGVYQNFNKNIVNEAFVFKNALNITLLFVIKVATSVTYLITLPILRYSYNKTYFPTTSACSSTVFIRIVLCVLISLIIDVVVFMLADKYLQVSILIYIFYSSLIVINRNITKDL